MEMVTSESSRYCCRSSYSMLTSHLPLFSEGQQLTREQETGRISNMAGQGGGGGRGERWGGRVGGEGGREGGREGGWVGPGPTMKKYNSFN